MKHSLNTIVSKQCVYYFSVITIQSETDYKLYKVSKSVAVPPIQYFVDNTLLLDV